MGTLTAALNYGANVRGAETEFRVWGPGQARVKVRLLGFGDFPMRRDSGGVFTATLPARAGQQYFYVLENGMAVPDPVSRFLPEGVHGPTEIVDPAGFHWTDSGWRGLDIRDYILYELHVGAFSPEGTFDGVVKKLEYLRGLGITAIELMPVAAFPGTRNWGYDGVAPYAVQASYGGPDGLKRLVNAAHHAGLAVILDVVYNHLGPEGNYLRQFGPYFTNRHETPWGEAINYDGPDSAEVRRYFVENALYWIREYHMDGLRLDAVQTIQDDSPRHIVAEIAQAVPGLSSEPHRTISVMAETDENDVRYVLPRPRGYGMDAIWSDDFHHALHTLLAGEHEGYYQDFGRPELLARALNEGFAFQGEPFAFWQGRPRGTPTNGVPLYRHIICTQNHDQVGNRARGERLTDLVPSGALKLAAALLLLAPHTPLLFMGQEKNEPQPFQFFTDHGDAVLQKAVSEGRRNEFKDFTWDQVPDPQNPATYERSKLSWPEAESADAQRQAAMLDWYKRLIDIRKQVITPGERTCLGEWHGGALAVQIPHENPRIRVIAGFPGSRIVEPNDGWDCLLSSDDDGYHVSIYQRR